MSKKKKIEKRIDMRIEKAKMRQRPLMKEVLDGSGKTIKKAGKKIKHKYSEAYLKSGELTKTKAWQELLEEEIPDQLLTKVHKGLLKHKDWRARDAGLDKGYKVKKRYANGIKFTSKWDGKSKEEIIEFILE